MYTRQSTNIKSKIVPNNKSKMVPKLLSGSESLRDECWFLVIESQRLYARYVLIKAVRSNKLIRRCVFISFVSIDRSYLSNPFFFLLCPFLTFSTRTTFIFLSPLLLPCSPLFKRIAATPLLIVLSFFLSIALQLVAALSREAFTATL